MIDNPKKKNRYYYELLKGNEKKLVFIHVENMAGLRSFDYDLRHLSNKQLNIIIGPNGFGKSTIFEGLEWLFSKTDEYKDLHCDYISYVFKKSGCYDVFQCRKASTNNGEEFRFFWASSYKNFDDAKMAASNKIRARSYNSLHPITRDIEQIREYFRDSNFVKVSSSRLSRNKETEQLKAIADAIITEDVADRFGFDLYELKRYVFSPVPYAVRLENNITESLMVILNSAFGCDESNGDGLTILPIYYLCQDIKHKKLFEQSSADEMSNQIFTRMVDDIFPLLDRLFGNNLKIVADLKKQFDRFKWLVEENVNLFIVLYKTFDGNLTRTYLAFSRSFDTHEKLSNYVNNKLRRIKWEYDYDGDGNIKSTSATEGRDTRDENDAYENMEKRIQDALSVLKKAVALKDTLGEICSDLDYRLNYDIFATDPDYPSDYRCRLKIKKRVFESFKENENEYVDFDIDSLSSGEANLLSILCSFFECSFDKRQNFLFIDEPEISLHPEWQARIVDGLLKLDQTSNVTVYISTHSPDVIASHSDMVADFQITHRNRN